MLHAQLRVREPVRFFVFVAGPLAFGPREDVHVFAVGDRAIAGLPEPAVDRRVHPAFMGPVVGVATGMHVVVGLGSRGSRPHRGTGRIEPDDEVAKRAGFPRVVVPRFIRQHPHDDRGMVPQPGHPSGRVRKRVAVKLLPLLRRVTVVAIVVEHRELGQDHRAVLVADIGPELGRRLGVGAENIDVHLAGFLDQVGVLLSRDDVAPVPFVDEVGAAQPKRLPAEPIVAVDDPDLAHAEANAHLVEHVFSAQKPDVRTVQVALLVRPRLEVRHGYVDEEMLAAEQVRRRNRAVRLGCRDLELAPHPNEADVRRVLLIPLDEPAGEGYRPPLE